MGRKKRGDMSSKKIRISYTIYPELVDRIHLLAKTHHQSVSSVFEEAVLHFLDLVEKEAQETVEEIIEIEAPKQSRLKRRPKND